MCFNIQPNYKLKQWHKINCSFCANLGSPAFPLSIMDGTHKAGVVPILDHIVWTIVNLNFNCITSIVYEEDDALLSTMDHC